MQSTAPPEITMKTDTPIIEALIARDEAVTRQFFFNNCRPLFRSIIHHVFSYEVDYDEFVNEFYLYLLENDACRLRQFEGRSSIYQWLKVVAIRYFISKRNRMIDIEHRNPPLENMVRKRGNDEERTTTARIDVRSILAQMPNQRYARVIERLMLDEAEPRLVALELETNVNNLYNLKKRAMAALTRIIIKEIGNDEEKIGK